MPRVHIIGQGAIGLLYGYFLKSVADVTFYLKQPSTAKQYHYQVGKSVELCDFNHQTSNNLEPIEFVIIPTKAYAVLEAFMQIKPRLTKNAVIILSHNGMGSIEQIAPLLVGQQQLYFLTTTQAAYKPAPLHVIHTGQGASNLGPINHAAKQSQHQVAAFLKPAFAHLNLVSDIDQLLWQKLLINVAINPLSAVHNVQNGQLTAPHFASQVFNLVYEVYLVAQSQGIRLELAKALQLAYQVMRSTADNYSSLNRDITLGKTTEITAICGYVVEIAKLQNIQTPFNKQMLGIVKALEKTKKSAPVDTPFH